jgi:transcriptional regulator with XRE-family HTH domain
MTFQELPIALDSDTMGARIGRARRQLGLTLDEPAARTRSSKPYLSLIKTNRVPNPPSDEKLRHIERVLNFPPDSLVVEPHLLQTPPDVRAMLPANALAMLHGGCSARRLVSPPLVASSCSPLSCWCYRNRSKSMAASNVSGRSNG